MKGRLTFGTTGWNKKFVRGDWFLLLVVTTYIETSDLGLFLARNIATQMPFLSSSAAKGGIEPVI